VHRLQTMRKTAGFEIADYIVTYYQGDDYVKRVMTNYTDYVKLETLSRNLIEGKPEEGVADRNLQAQRPCGSAGSKESLGSRINVLNKLAVSSETANFILIYCHMYP
jgi:hypothetical protein